MAATLTVENIFQQQDINVRKQLFNECLAHMDAAGQNRKNLHHYKDYKFPSPAGLHNQAALIFDSGYFHCLPCGNNYLMNVLPISFLMKKMIVKWYFGQRNRYK